MPARKQNASQLASKHIKSISTRVCQAPPMIDLFWQNPSYDSEHKKFIYTCVDQNQPWIARTRFLTCFDHTTRMPAITQNPYQHVFQIPPHATETQNAYKHALTKPLPCQRAHKKHLNMCWRNPTHASEETKCISTCVDQSPTCDDQTEWHRIRQMHLNTWGSNPSTASKDTKSIIIYVNQNLTMPVRTQNASQHVYKPIP